MRSRSIKLYIRATGEELNRHIFDLFIIIVCTEIQDSTTAITNYMLYVLVIEIHIERIHTEWIYIIAGQYVRCSGGAAATGTNATFKFINLFLLVACAWFDCTQIVLSTNTQVPTVGPTLDGARL